MLEIKACCPKYHHKLQRIKLDVIQHWHGGLVNKKSCYSLSVVLMPESTFSPTATSLCCECMEKY